ncbi:MAG: Fic family protein [Planctomycetota bacterium]|jgi:Fic family protein
MEELSRKRLTQFDLEKELEEALLKNTEKHMKLFGLLALIHQTYTVDQFIKDCPSYPDSNEDIIKREIISSVGATLAIEGTVLRDEEIEESFQKADLKTKLKNKEQEAENTRKAYTYIIRTVDSCKGKFVYSEKHIKKIHYYLTHNVESISPNVPGQYRDTSARFGEPRRVSLLKSRAEIAGAMTKFAEWLNEDNPGILTSDPIVKAMMAHYYLAEIHPFGDGNGRTARALEALILYVNLKNPSCFAILARFWGAHRNEYIVNLGHIRTSLNPMDFLVFGVNGYLEEVTRVKELVLTKVKQLMLQDYMQWLYRKGRIHPRVLNVVKLLISIGKTPFKDFLSAVEPIYAERKERTRYRDFKTLQDLELVHITKENGTKSIEPNFAKLEKLQYAV